MPKENNNTKRNETEKQKSQTYTGKLFCKRHTELSTIAPAAERWRHEITRMLMMMLSYCQWPQCLLFQTWHFYRHFVFCMFLDICHCLLRFVRLSIRRLPALACSCLCTHTHWNDDRTMDDPDDSDSCYHRLLAMYRCCLGDEFNNYSHLHNVTLLFRIYVHRRRRYHFYVKSKIVVVVPAHFILTETYLSHFCFRLVRT